MSLEAYGTKFTFFELLSRIGVFGPCWALQPFPSIQSFCLASLEVASGPRDFLFSQLLPLLGLTNGPILLITLFLRISKAPSIFLEHPCEHKPSFLRNILEKGVQVRHFHCDVGEDGSNVIRVYVPQSIFLCSWPHPERVPCLGLIHRTTHSLSQHILHRYITLWRKETLGPLSLLFLPRWRNEVFLLSVLALIHVSTGYEP